MDFDDDDCPPRLFHKLCDNVDFRMFFADRVQRLLFPGGVLAPERAARRYELLVNQIQKAIVVESARWGNYRRDVHQYKLGPYEFYKPDIHWQPEVNRLLSRYFLERPAAFLAQLRERGLFPRTPAPTGQIRLDTLALAAREGTIYYAIGGADPRFPGGAVSPIAQRYEQPIVLKPGQRIRARAAFGAGTALEWSALAEFGLPAANTTSASIELAQ